MQEALNEILCKVFPITFENHDPMAKGQMQILKMITQLIMFYPLNQMFYIRSHHLIYIKEKLRKSQKYIFICLKFEIMLPFKKDIKIKKLHDF